MSTVLLMGKDLPDSIELAESITKSGRILFTSAKPEAEIANFESENIFSCICNKNSTISSHSYIIKAETKLKTIDEVIIIFDSPLYLSKFGLDKSEEISLAVDSMINSYLFFTSELIKRIDQCKDKICVSFLVKTLPSKYELLSSPAKTNIMPATNIVSAAEKAFCSIAENFATYVSDRNYLSVILAKKPYNSDAFQSDTEIGNWLISAFDTIKSAKHPQTFKQASNWYKTGSKISTGFLLFK